MSGGVGYRSDKNGTITPAWPDLVETAPATSIIYMDEQFILYRAEMANTVRLLEERVRALESSVSALKVKAGFWGALGVVLGALGVVLLKVV